MKMKRSDCRFLHAADRTCRELAEICVTATLTVTDAESLTVTIAPASISEKGGSATGTVTRSNSDTSQPAVVRHAGQQRSQPSDTAERGDDSARFRQCATVTVTRNNSDLGQPLVVSLGSSDTTEATLPDSVTIPATVASATVVVTGVDEQEQVTSFTDTNGQYVTLVVPTGVSLESPQILANPSPTNAPASVEFPEGFLDFRLTGGPPAAQMVTFVLVPGSGVNDYFLFGPTPTNSTPHWYSFLYDGQTGAKILTDRIELYLLDGARGDADLTANGVIDDPGAPAVNLAPFPWRNTAFAMDVNNDSLVSALDALLIIGELNARGGHDLPVPRIAPIGAANYFDVSGDNTVAAIDALRVIGKLNQRLAPRRRPPRAAPSWWRAGRHSPVHRSTFVPG